MTTPAAEPLDAQADDLALVSDFLSSALQDIAPEGVEIVNSKVAEGSGVKISELVNGFKVLVQAASGETLELREFLVNTLPSIITKLDPQVWYAFACTEEPTFGVILFQSLSGASENSNIDGQAVEALFKDAEEQGLLKGVAKVTAFDVASAKGAWE